MSLPKEKFREIELLLLFCYEESAADREEQWEHGVHLVMEVLRVSRRYALEAKEKVEQLLCHLSQIDALIDKFAIDYSLERIQKTELAVLRLAVFELLHQRQVPAKVVIAEAVRLTKKFSSNQAAHFVNALLDRVYHHDLEASSSDPAATS